MRLAKVESLLTGQSAALDRIAAAMETTQRRFSSGEMERFGITAGLHKLAQPERRHGADTIETCTVRWQTIQAGDIVWWTDTGTLDPTGPGEWRQVVKAEPSARYIGDVVISIYEAESETEVSCQFPQIDLATVQNPIGPRT